VCQPTPHAGIPFRLHLRVEHGAKAVPVILAALDAEGVAVNAVTVSRPSLDDVYLHHTGRDFRSDDEGAASS
jgi:ABC-2 type transport system ATP-binding protein